MSTTHLPAGLVARAQLPSPVGPLTVAATDTGLALLAFDAHDHPGLHDVPEQPRQR